MKRRSFCVALIAVLAFGSAVVAAPVPKKKSTTVDVSVARAEKDSDRLIITVANNTQETVTWKHTTSPLAAFGLEVTNAKGEQLEVTHPDVILSPFGEARTVVVKPGDEFAVKTGLGRWFTGGKRPAGKLTVKVIFRHGETKYESDPLVVE